MTEFDIIKSLDIDHMAEWLSNIWDCNLCAEHQNISDNPLSEDACDNQCIKHCKEWLMTEVEITGRYFGDSEPSKRNLDFQRRVNNGHEY